YYGNKAWIESMLNYHDNKIKSLDNRNELIPYLSRHQERVFCYELYHQFRKILEQKQNELTEEWILQGEPRKGPIGSEIEAYCEVKSIDKVYYPDFLVHEPNQMNNGLIIEVKANPRLTIKDMKKDILKIDQFINKYEYQKGVFLAINITRDRLKELLKDSRLIEPLKEQVICKYEILLMFKESAEEEIISINLGKLLKDGLEL
ncbi:hypothetical protein, partial [Terribacillus saccharophilus]|uniref:hypothetical protein n=1 Tax=Terribacillus saccharophilus TaxID=361277 RepID=UPI0015CC95E5